MNESGKQPLKGLDSQSDQPNICDACMKKDDEDVYIVFNVLYRVILGDLFYQRLNKDDINLDVDLLEEERSKQITEEAKSGEEKLRHFQQEVSTEILVEIMTSSHFDQLLKEILKSKYARIDETACNHQDLTRHFIDSFNINNFQNVKKEKTSLKIDRLDDLLSSIQKLKENIQKYNAEISRLPNHIMTRLFESHTHSAKKSPIRADDTENINESSGNSKEDDSVPTKGSSNNINGNGSSSSNGLNNRSDLSTNYESNGINDSGSGSNQNNGSGGSGSSDQSTESNNAADNNRKRSKALPFKSKLPKKATDILKSWFLSNIKNPYPSHEAKENLSKLTGLTRKQIQNWFTNSRKRFLEPLKKKIDGKASSGLTPSDAPAIEPVVEVPQAQPIIANPVLTQALPEAPVVQSNPQLKQVPQFISPVAAPTMVNPAIGNPTIIRPVVQQRIQQPQIQNPAIIYSGMLPQGGMQHGNNILIVPCIVPQTAPMTYYRQPEFVPISGLNGMNPSFIQIPQGSIGNFGNVAGMATIGNMPNMQTIPNIQNLQNLQNVPNLQNMQQIDQSSLNQNQMVSYPYLVPIQQLQQPNLMEMRGANPHSNLANNYNTINNNVYNNINGMGSGMPQMVPLTPIGPLGNPNMTLMNMGGFPNLPQQPGITAMGHMITERPASVGKVNQNDMSGNIFNGSMTSPRDLQRGIGGVYHPRPDLDEMGLQGRKHLHKDHNPENDTN